MARRSRPFPNVMTVYPSLSSRKRSEFRDPGSSSTTKIDKCWLEIAASPTRGHRSSPTNQLGFGAALISIKSRYPGANRQPDQLGQAGGLHFAHELRPID